MSGQSSPSALGKSKQVTQLNLSPQKVTMQDSHIVSQNGSATKMKSILKKAEDTSMISLAQPAKAQSIIELDEEQLVYNQLNQLERNYDALKNESNA